MKKIVTTEKKIEISVSELTGRESIVYQCKNTEGVCVLARLTLGFSHPANYGFIPLFGVGVPRFVGESFFSCVHKAAAARQLYIYENQTDLISFLNKAE